MPRIDQLVHNKQLHDSHSIVLIVMYWCYGITNLTLWNRVMAPQIENIGEFEQNKLLRTSGKQSQKA